MTAPLRLLLFMTRGMSLQAWHDNGSLERELALYAAMAEHGIRTEIISWGDRADVEIARQFPWLRVHVNRCQLPQERYERLMPLLHALPLIRADVIKCNQTNGGDLALRCARFWRKPFVARCGYVWSDIIGREQSPLLDHVLQLERKVFSGCNRAIVTSKAAVRYLAHTHELPQDSFVHIPNYVPNAFYAAPLPDYNQPVPAIITQVGRLAPEKNLFALLDACADIDDPKLLVRLIGDGTEREALAAHAQQLGVAVEFLGSVPHAKLPELLAESMVCALVSHFEGHPKALIEYMACGCPIVAADAPGINTVIQDGVSGILCATDAAAIRAGLQKLLRDPALRECLGRQAREEAQHYTLDAALQQEWKIHTSFPRMAPLQKWAIALGALASFATRVGRSLLAGYVRIPQRLYARLIRFCIRRLEDACPEEAHRLLNMREDQLLASLPDDQVVAYLEECINRRITDNDPADALRLLFALDARLYPKQGQLAVAYGGGVHTKHRHTKYHDFFVNRLQKDETVLDVGCGIGALAFDMAEKAQAVVTGIDLSEANIRTARERFAHPGVTYTCGNALTGLPGGAYDAIVLSNVLEHLPKRSEFLRSLQTRFSPRRFLLRVPLFERDWRVPLKQELGVEWRLDASHETEYTLESFAEELEAAHLRAAHQEVRWSEIWCEAQPR